MKGYYFITDCRLSRAGNLSDVKKAVAAKATAVQYRRKDASSGEMYREAMRLRKICRGVPFLINDRVDIALGVDADGVHLGQEDLPCRTARKILGKGKIIGVTVHSLKQAAAAEKNGADYLAVSPIFATATKPDAGRPKGLVLLRKVKKRAAIPVVAIGGINYGNAAGVIAAGADAVCAISSVVTRRDVKKAIAEYQKLFA